MGKPTGFIEYLRELPVDRTPLERIQDWREFHFHMEDKRLRQQGARCMDCGVPFCHTGKLMNGGASGCPVNNLIPRVERPGVSRPVARGIGTAAQDQQLPRVHGPRVPGTLRGSCVLGINAPPVTIKNIENAIIDKGWDEGWVYPVTPPERTGKKVAVVGSGPAGLAAAAQLNQAGHLVTVFERADRPGGLLMYGIPNMKLDKREVVMRRIKVMEESGIKFECGANVGTNMDSQTLRKDFDAVVLCTGATVPRDLNVDGRQLGGVHFAMDYLTGSTKALLNGGPDPRADTCKGQGCDRDRRWRHRHRLRGHRHAPGLPQRTQFEIMPEPPQDRARGQSLAGSGRRSIAWTMARRKRPPASVAIRACS